MKVKVIGQRSKSQHQKTYFQGYNILCFDMQLGGQRSQDQGQRALGQGLRSTCKLLASDLVEIEMSFQFLQSQMSAFRKLIA